MLNKGCYRISIVFVWTGENDSTAPRVDEHLVKNGEKKSPFSNISGYVWTGPKSLARLGVTRPLLSRFPSGDLVLGLPFHSIT